MFFLTTNFTIIFLTTNFTIIFLTTNYTNFTNSGAAKLVQFVKFVVKTIIIVIFVVKTIIIEILVDNKVIGAAGQRFQYSFHLHLEEEGSKLTDRYIRLNR